MSENNYNNNQKFDRIYLENFEMWLKKPMDMASVFHSSERLDSFLSSMIEQSYELHGGIYPMVYEEKHHVFNVDYHWLLDCLVTWLGEVGGADMMQVREYIKKYFVSLSEPFNFPSRYLIFVIFGLTYSILGGYLPDFTKNKKNKIRYNSGRDNSYFGGLPYYQNCVYFSEEKDIHFKFKSISFVEYKLYKVASDAGEKMLELSQKSGLKQVAFGYKQMQKMEEIGTEMTHFYYIEAGYNDKNAENI